MGTTRNTTNRLRKTCTCCGHRPATTTDHEGDPACKRCAEQRAEMAARMADLRLRLAEAKAAGRDPRFM